MLDVGVRDVPADDVSLLIAKRETAREKPSIPPVRSANAPFAGEWRAFGQRRAPQSRQPIPVLRVNGLEEPIALDVVQRAPDIFEQALIAVINRAVGGTAPDEMGDHIGQLVQCFVGSRELAGSL